MQSIPRVSVKQKVKNWCLLWPATNTSKGNCSETCKFNRRKHPLGSSKWCCNNLGNTLSVINSFYSVKCLTFCDKVQVDYAYFFKLCKLGTFLILPFRKSFIIMSISRTCVYGIFIFQGHTFPLQGRKVFSNILMPNLKQ